MRRALTAATILTALLVPFLGAGQIFRGGFKQAATVLQTRSEHLLKKFGGDFVMLLVSSLRVNRERAAAELIDEGRGCRPPRRDVGRRFLPDPLG